MAPPLAFWRHLHASAGQVWKVITDTRTWPVWGPSVQRVDCPVRYIQAGCSGRILTPIGLWLPFRVTIVEPGIYWEWHVSGIRATGHRIEPIGTERCRLAFTVPVWAALYGPVCYLALLRIDRLMRSNPINPKESSP